MNDKNQDKGSAQSTDAFDSVMDIWNQSQEAFLRAQEQVAEQFTQSVKQMASTVEEEAAGPVEAWQNLMKTWMPVWNPDFESGKTNPFDTDFTRDQQAFFDLFDPQKWTAYAPEQLRIMLNQIARGPQFADLATPQQDAAEMWRESVDYQEAAADMAKVMHAAWTTAYNEYTQTHTLEDLQAGKLNEALNAWIKAANTSLLQAQGSPEFLDAQRRMIRASTEVRARQRDTAERWSSAWQMPTRTEVDDLVQTVHQLRRELREVKRELAKLKAGA